MTRRLMPVLVPVLVWLLSGCASAVTAPTDPRCIPPKAQAATSPDTLPGGVIQGDWSLDEWEKPPFCR